MNALDSYIVKDEMKPHVLECFETGFVSHFEYPLPEPWGSVENYEPLLSKKGREMLQRAMSKQVEEGKMIGGPGWTAEMVRNFFGGQNFYGIPCGVTEKDGDPFGRIVHDYGFYKRGGYSINATHSSTSVKYLTFLERASILQNVQWYIKADLASGFRQFGTHPVDWRMQVYCNGPHEHYIDLACPFGKTNSPLEVCPPVSLFARSAAMRYAEEMNCGAPVLGSHVDDIFGGFLLCNSYEKACHFRAYLCRIGELLTIKFNRKPTKTPLPSKRQIILGCLWNSVDRRVRTSEKKKRKYLARIMNLLSRDNASVKEILQIHGNLNYAAEVIPFGRPFLAPLSNLTVEHEQKDMVNICPLSKMGLRV